jgi:malonyl CoA-acyl carrier protein transacylase/NAD(P)-dependent dehydrogenase (short-subunit alcohol dehydrogenase family)/acyl carrier protein
MASELLEESALFAERIEECEAALSPYVDFSLTEILRSEEEQWLSQVEVVQPALFGVMVALAELWREHGVAPQAVIGHSQGEIAAAVIAGALSLKDGAKLTALRSKALLPLMGEGEMASFALSAEELQAKLAPYGERVSIAAQNGPRSTVASGEPKALEELIAEVEGQGARARLIPVGYASHCAQIERIEAELKEAIADIEPGEAQVPIYSTLTGERIDAKELTPDYWYRNLREQVRFGEATEALLKDGFSTFIEVSPHPVLSIALGESTEAAIEDPSQVAILGTLRRDEGGMRRFTSSLAQAHVEGIAVDFAPLLKDSAPRLTELPTYPFQRQRYWLEPSAGTGDPASLGQSATEHPMLGAQISLPAQGHLFTGRIGAETHPWVEDHAISGTALLPGTAFAELALAAGARLGAERIEEMLLEAPLIVPRQGAIQIRLSLTPREDDPESYDLEVHSRAEAPAEDQGEDQEERPWTRNASGTLAPQEEPLSLGFDVTAWPPPGAEPIAVEDFYEQTAEIGLDYGPAFQGLDAAWRLGEEIYAEVSLAEEQRPEAQRFGVHPALLDAALHPMFLDVDPGAVMSLPFSLAGVRLGEAGGAAELRVRVRVEEGRIALDAADPDGTPVCSVESLTVRQVDPAMLQAAAKPPNDLFALEWIEADLPEAEPQGVEVHRVAPPQDVDAAQAAHSLTAEILEAIQGFLSQEDSGETRLAILTEGAVATGGTEAPDPAQAAVWGLVRSAQSEHPGRLLLIDSDGSEASQGALPNALANAEEPQIALREGALRVPRLAAVKEDAETQAPSLDPEGTVLITGGLSGLGALAARHLASAHGAKHLLLTSRRGPEAPGASELIAELAELGCEAQAVACDVSDRKQLEAMLAEIPTEYPLTAVLHSAGVLDDGLLADLDPERLDKVLAPKADAAWHLHELTREAGLSAFVLYSSAAASLGSPGQANYAAANSFLDALAERRRAEGLAATAIAWGMWEQESELTSGLDEAGRARLQRTGLIPIDNEQGLELFDRARRAEPALLVAVPFERRALRRLAGAELLPPLLSDLIGPMRRRAQVPSDSLARRLAEVPPEEHRTFVLGLVLEHVAAVLGHTSTAAIDPQANFKDLGFDSLGAVELRNRLIRATGIRLDATLVFDHPTSEAVARHLLSEVSSEGAGDAGVDPQEAEIRQRLATIPIARMQESGVLEMLLALSGQESEQPVAAGTGDEIDEMDVDDLVRRSLETAGTHEEAG